MTAKLQKKGNALCVTIPKKMAQKANLSLGTEIEMKYEGRTIIIFPKVEKEPTFKELVSKINKDNLNVLEDDYVPVGKEVW